MRPYSNRIGLLLPLFKYLPLLTGQCLLKQGRLGANRVNHLSIEGETNAEKEGSKVGVWFEGKERMCKQASNQSGHGYDSLSFEHDNYQQRERLKLLLIRQSLASSPPRPSNKLKPYRTNQASRGSCLPRHEMATRR